MLDKLSPPPIRALILDMDGVVWKASEPIGDLPAIFARVHALGLRVMLVTNNSTRSPDFYLDKLAGFGVHVEPWQLITSAIATASYLKHKYPQGGRVYVVGEVGLHEALAEQGFVHADKDVLAVVAGLDREFTYEKLKAGTLLVRKGATLIGTNTDHSLPTPDGQIPGAGSIVGALEIASATKAIVIGKPSPASFNAAMQRLGAQPQETLVVGDRLETDIAGGQNAGCKTAVVLSGVTTEEQARAWTPRVDLIAPDLAAIVGAG